MIIIIPNLLPCSRIALWLIALLAIAPLLIGSSDAQFVQARNSTGAIIAESESNQGIDRFAFATSVHPEYGVWTYPVLVASASFFTLLVLYYKKWIPYKVQQTIQLLVGFEASKLVAFVIVLGLLSIYVGFSSGELFQKEKGIDDPNSDYGAAKIDAENLQQRIMFQGGAPTPAVKYILTAISLYVFGNTRVVPFMISIALLILVYFTARQMSGRRISGVVAMGVLMQSTIFLKYDSDTVYHFAWIMFYLLSIYLIHRKWQLSVPAYLASFLSKALAASFMPFTLVSIMDSPLDKRKKLLLAIPYGLFLAFFLYTVTFGINLPTAGFTGTLFWTGLNSVPILLRFEGLVLVILLPVTVSLYLLARQGAVSALSILFLIGGMIWIPAFLYGITGTPNLDYRMISLIVFVAIGFGLVFSKRDRTSIIIGSLARKVILNLVFLVTLPAVILVITTFFFPALYSDQNFR